MSSSREFLHREIANGLAALVLATRSYTVLDRLANAISSDAVYKAIYELGRSLDVILRNPKEGQKIEVKENEIIVEGYLQKETTFIIKGRLPNEYDYSKFLEDASKDIKVARETASFASGLIASKIAEATKKR